MARLNSAGVTSVTRPKTVVIALFTQTSIGPSSILDPRCRRFHLVGIRDVVRTARPFPPSSLDFARGGMKTLRIAREQTHMRALARESANSRASYARRSTRDHDDSSLVSSLP